MKLQPKWKNEPDFDDLNKDLLMTNSSHSMIREALMRRDEQFNGGKPLVSSTKGRSVTRPKLIRKQAEWKYASLEEPFLSTQDMFKIRPRTAEDVDAANQNEILINYQWSTKVKKTKFINDVVRYLVDEGTAIVKVGWEAEEGTTIVEEDVPDYATPEESVAMLRAKVQSGQLPLEQAQMIMQSGQPMQKGTKREYVEKTVLTKNQPTYMVCNTANVRIDPTCEGVITDANFIIHEYDTSFAELKKDEYTVTHDEEDYFDTKTATIQQRKVKRERGFYKNLDVLGNMELATVSDPYGSVSGRTFTFNDKPRKKIRAYEYWGYWDINGDDILVPIVATWVENVMIRLEENPFPHKRLPFATSVYMPVKREVHGQSDGDLLVDNQNTIGRMIRAAEDITVSMAVGQTFIDEQMFPSPAQKANYEKGNTVYFKHGVDPRTAIHKQTVEPVPQSIFQMVQMQNAEAEALSGTKAFGQPSNGDAVGNANNPNSKNVNDATSKRELSILRRLSEMFKDIARMTVSMNQTFLEEQEIIRITNQFVAIRRDDLVGDFDFDMDISTPEKDNEIAQKLTMLLQTNVANMNPEVQHKMYKKLAMLWKMPDLAQDLGEYQAPQPDQSEQQMRALQLENLRLENIKLKKSIDDLDSKISERIAIAIDKEADRLTKAAQADYFDGRANQANAMADSINQNFIHQQNGVDVQNKMALNDQQNQANFKSQAAAAEHKRLSDLDKMAFQHHLGQASDRDNHVRTKDAMAFQNQLNNESDPSTVQQDNNATSDDMSSGDDANPIQTQQGE
jgi:hypothetical protein